VTQLRFVFLALRVLSVTLLPASGVFAQIAPVKLAPVAMPPAASLYGPAANSALNGASVRFQWLAGAGLTTAARYEICVRPSNGTCADPAAMIIRPTGTLLTEPLLPPSLPPTRPTRGDPTFGSQPGRPGVGPAPYFLSATLPTDYQGRRLLWSVRTCVPRTGNARLGAANEICSESAPWLLTWVLPIPTLAAPASDSLLGTLSPVFSWSYSNTQGVENFLVCVGYVGLPCPVAPTLQDKVMVASVQQGMQFTAAQGFGSFMGEQLQWSVAACNRELGCTYAQPRTFRVPAIDGSFEAIYAVTQDVRCKNCHQMTYENETYQRHLRLGRFTRELVPPYRVDGLVEVNGQYVSACVGCHTAATGFTDGWFAPLAGRDFDVPLEAAPCVRFRENGFLTAGGRGHLEQDPNILWAVARIANVGVQGWQHKVSAWFDNGAPCICTQRPISGSKTSECATARLHGKFTP
jgi:hypothetical protein